MWSISEIDLFRKQFFCLFPSFCHTQPVRACQRLDLVSKVLDECLDFVLGDEPGAGFAPPGPPPLLASAAAAAPAVVAGSTGGGRMNSFWLRSRRHCWQRIVLRLEPSSEGS